MTSTLSLLSYVFVIFGFAFLPSAEMKGKLTTVMRIERLGNCPEMPDLPHGFISSEVYQLGKTQFGRGDFAFRQNITRLTKAVAHLRKCADRNDPNCETFQNWRFGDETCSLVTMKNMIWTPLFAATPPITCPVKKGIYHFENVTVDVQRLKLINFPDQGYWKVSVIVDTDHIKGLCYYFECTFIRVRL